jgi:hypothetical protein
MFRLLSLNGHDVNKRKEEMAFYLRKVERESEKTGFAKYAVSSGHLMRFLVAHVNVF